LLPYLTGTTDPGKLEQRIRYTETGFNTKLVLAGKYNDSGLISEGAAYYELASHSGWMQLRGDRLSELMAQKQRAALTPNSLLAAVPNIEDGSTTYWLTDRRTPLPHRIMARPDPTTEPEGARLWDALQDRFAGELSVPALASPM
jgi:hypothetical protein